MLLDQTETPLVLVRPDDRAETVLERARQTGAARVQLLVPDGVAALQHPQEVERLARLAAEAGISLVLISSDPATLEAARLSKVPTVAVSGTQVTAPPRPAPPPAPEPQSADEAFMASLDDLDAGLAARPSASGDEDLSAAAASLAAALKEPQAP
ncbi:MAG: hypothetical protein HGA45_31090, partial [Chloroflexales bacterium]|nr:hypothetical protein [Chloroflexales bacterium]